MGHCNYDTLLEIYRDIVILYITLPSENCLAEDKIDRDDLGGTL
jgi:hypothetical protein